MQDQLLGSGQFGFYVAQALLMQRNSTALIFYTRCPTKALDGGYEMFYIYGGSGLSLGKGIDGMERALVAVPPQISRAG